MKKKKFFIGTLIFLFTVINIPVFAEQDFQFQRSIKRKGFLYELTFDELVTLSMIEDVEDPLKTNLSKILYNPVFNNTISIKNFTVQKDPVLGDFIRVAGWNIARGLNFDTIKLIFKKPDEFILKVKEGKKKLDKEEIKEIEKQIKILKNTDIFLLNEVDIGMPRTKYRNIAEEFAEMLGFNYAYGLEFVEVDPTHLGLEDHEWSEENILFPDKDYEIDKDRYKGFHGNAIISRFPLENVRIIRFPDYYDWFNTEKGKIANLEVARRKAAKLIFDESVLREIRRGSRIALLADIQVPGLETPVTLISVHLENRVVPEYRHKQIEYLIKKIKHIKNPVIMGGDFNTTTKDGRPTTVLREIRKRLTDFNYMAKHLVYLAIPYTYVVKSINLAKNVTRKHNNPTVFHIPVISPNPERKLFKALENLEFADGGSFDFSGEKYQSVKDKWGMLANSNQRSLKGFAPTFKFTRDWLIGQFKLDWLFVKPCETCAFGLDEDGEEDEELKKLTPYFGRTLLELNYALEYPVSDHVPITVDLPLNPPNEHETEKAIHLLEKLKKTDTAPLPD